MESENENIISKDSTADISEETDVTKKTKESDEPSFEEKLKETQDKL